MVIDLMEDGEHSQRKQLKHQVQQDLGLQRKHAAKSLQSNRCQMSQRNELRPIDRKHSRLRGIDEHAALIQDRSNPNQGPRSQYQNMMRNPKRFVMNVIKSLDNISDQCANAINIVSDTEALHEQYREEPPRRIENEVVATGHSPSKPYLVSSPSNIRKMSEHSELKIGSVSIRRDVKGTKDTYHQQLLREPPPRTEDEVVATLLRKHLEPHRTKNEIVPRIKEKHQKPRKWYNLVYGHTEEKMESGENMESNCEFTPLSPYRKKNEVVPHVSPIQKKYQSQQERYDFEYQNMMSNPKQYAVNIIESMDQMSKQYENTTTMNEIDPKDIVNPIVANLVSKEQSTERISSIFHNQNLEFTPKSQLPSSGRIWHPSRRIQSGDPCEMETVDIRCQLEMPEWRRKQMYLKYLFAKSKHMESPSFQYGESSLLNDDSFLAEIFQRHTVHSEDFMQDRTRIGLVEYNSDAKNVPLSPSAPSVPLHDDNDDAFLAKVNQRYNGAAHVQCQRFETENSRRNMAAIPEIQPNCSRDTDDFKTLAMYSRELSQTLVN